MLRYGMQFVDKGAEFYEAKATNLRFQIIEAVAAQSAGVANGTMRAFAPSVRHVAAVR